MEITFAEVPAGDDQVTEREGTRVFVAPEVAVLLSSAALDIEPKSEARSWSLRSMSQAERPDGPPWALPPSSAPVSAATVIGRRWADQEGTPHGDPRRAATILAL